MALAARLWESPELAGPAHGALVKLRAAGVEVDEDQGRAQPRVRGGEPAFGPLLAAVQAGRAVTFDYRRGGPAGEVARRTVEPWGVVSWRGRWYVVGHDRDRAAPRSFRVSRIVGPVRAIGPSGAVSVPSDVDLLAMVRGGVEPPPVVGTARVWVAEGRAYGLRRLGRVRRGRAGTRAARARRSSWSCAASTRSPAGWRATAPDIAVLDPPALAERVRANWEAAAAHAAHAGRGGRPRPRCGVTTAWTAPTCFLPRRRREPRRRALPAEAA